MSSGPVLVTGATGFLGRHVLEALSAQGIPAVALVRDIDAWRAMDWTERLRSVTPVTSERDVGQIGAIVHLAAIVRHSRRHAGELYSVNVQGTLDRVQLAAEHGCRMIYASSSGVAGCFTDPSDSADEEAPYAWSTISDWPYYHSKAVAEAGARDLAAELGVELVVVRPPVLLGPGDHRFRSTGTLIRLLRGRLPFLVRGGMHFADVRDVAAAIVRLLSYSKPKPVYHFTGTICSIPEFFRMAEDASGLRAPRYVLPPRVARLLARLLRPLKVLPDPVVVEMATHYWATSSTHAEADLGYRSRDGRQTLRDTIEWLRGNHPELRRAG